MIARVTMLFGINSTNNAIKITRGKLECYFNSFASGTANSRPAFFLIICSVATLDSALTICIFEV